jgi:Family of unknown function (DUF6182)
MTAPLDQAALLGYAERRLAASGTSLDAFLGGEAADAEAPSRHLAAIVVLKAFDPDAFVAGARAFVSRLAPPTRADWYREFTRAVFLAGDPGRLAARFAFDHVASDGSCAWLAPAPPARHEALRRLLKPLRTDRPLAASRAPAPADRDGAGGRALRLLVATGGLRLEHYLVHLHHALCEAAIEGRLRPDDRVELGHVAEFDALPRPTAHVRVHRDAARADRLRLYAVLEEAERG